MTAPRITAEEIVKIQGIAVANGFKYWRAEDSHGVKGSTQQAIRLLQELIGVEVEIDDEHDEGCRECGPMHEALGKAFDESQKDQAEILRLRYELSSVTAERDQIRAGLDRLTAELQAVRDELKELRESVEWVNSMPPDEKVDQELHAAALLDLRRWERSRGPGAVGNPVMHYEDFLAFRAREHGRKEAQEAIANLKAELARVRRNHLRRMEGYLQRILWRCAIHPINRRNMGGWQRGYKLYNAIRAALANNAKDEA